MPAFAVGQAVHIVSAPERVGEVLDVRPGIPETSYRILLEGRSEVFYEGQLAPEGPINFRPKGTSSTPPSSALQRAAPTPEPAQLSLPLEDEWRDSRSLFPSPLPSGPPPSGRNPLAENPWGKPNPYLALTRLTPPKAMLLVADLDRAELLPEFQEEWGARVEPLAGGCLLPLWWPEEADGEPMSPEERLGDFEANLDIALGQSLSSWKASGTPSPVAPSWTPEQVLQTLVYLRYDLLGERPAPSFFD